MVSLGIVKQQPPTYRAPNTKFQSKSCQLWDVSWLFFTIQEHTHNNLYVHAKCTCKIWTQSNEKKRKRTRLQLYENYSSEQILRLVGEDDAVTYLHYILPAHPDHNCEKDALVRRQRGPEGSYPSLSGRRGDQVDWTQILLARLLYISFPPLLSCWELHSHTHSLRLHYAPRGITAQLHLEVKTKWGVSVVCFFLALLPFINNHAPPGLMKLLWNVHDMLRCSYKVKYVVLTWKVQEEEATRNRNYSNHTRGFACRCRERRRKRKLLPKVFLTKFLDFLSPYPLTWSWQSASNWLIFVSSVSLCALIVFFKSGDNLHKPGSLRKFENSLLSHSRTLQHPKAAKRRSDDLHYKNWIHKSNMITPLFYAFI